MASTAAPLRRSKRTRVSPGTARQATETVPKTTSSEATAPRKRGRKDVGLTADPVIKEAPAPKKPRHAEFVEPVAESASIQPQQPDQPLSPFLALPRELRDEIYKHVLEQDGSTTLKPGSRNIATRCGLVGVNNQICEEFLDAVLFYAPVITTTVRNHNFAHVVTFLNRLSQAQLARLSSRGSKAAELNDTKIKRKIRITLSYSAGARDSRAHLNRWLDRFDAPDKRGKEIEFEYDGDGTYHNGGYKQRPRIRSTASERWNEEAEKIGRAAARSVRAYGGWGGFYSD